MGEATTLSLSNGSIGQLQGPFTTDDRFIFTGLNNGKIFIKLGIIMNDKDAMSNPDFVININGELLKLGTTNIYELDDVMQIVNLSFPQNAPPSTIIDYVVMNT